MQLLADEAKHLINGSPQQAHPQTGLTTVSSCATCRLEPQILLAPCLLPTAVRNAGAHPRWSSVQHVLVGGAKSGRLEIEQQLQCPVGMSVILLDGEHAFAAGGAQCTLLQYMHHHHVSATFCMCHQQFTANALLFSWHHLIFNGPACAVTGLAGQVAVWQMQAEGSWAPDAVLLPPARQGSGIGDTITTLAASRDWLVACTASGSLALWNYHR